MYTLHEVDGPTTRWSTTDLAITKSLLSPSTYTP